MVGGEERDRRGTGKRRRTREKELTATMAHKQPLSAEAHNPVTGKIGKPVFLLPTNMWWKEGEQTVTDKRILISPDACVAPKSLQSASTLVAGPSDGAARKTVPSPPSGRGHRGSGRPVLPGTMLGLLGEHTSAQDSLKILANNVLPNHLVIASTSLEDSEASKSQHIQNRPQGFPPPKPVNYT